MDTLDVIGKVFNFVDQDYLVFFLLNHATESTLLLVAILTLNSLPTRSLVTLSFLRAYSCR